MDDVGLLFYVGSSAQKCVCRLYREVVGESLREVNFHPGSRERDRYTEEREREGEGEEAKNRGRSFIPLFQSFMFH